MSTKPPSEPSPSSSSPEDVLAAAQAGREIVQDFVPLAESLEWTLGQQYLRERGNKAFISDSSPVPFVINNDGTLSHNAAEVFFTSLVEADKAGSLEDDIFVLELGIGVGLFARFFLDHFQELCVKHKKNYYTRLCYVAADRSERMLFDVLRHGVLGNHPGRYCVRCIDAMKPDEALAGAPFHRMKGKPFRAVFLNYLLDCLPAAVLEIDGDHVKQLSVRTCVARTVKLADYTDLTISQLQERAKSSDPRAKQELLEVYGLFASEYDYRPVDVKTLPHGAFAVEVGRRWSKRVLLNHGAITALDKLLELIAEDGFILINDYGNAHTSHDDDFEHQRFSYATFVGVNFPLVEAYFADAGKCKWLAPPGDEQRGIHTRLMSRRPSVELTVRFNQTFSTATYDALQDPIAKARGCLQYGKLELASDFYRKALKLQPRNWLLLNEVSSFLTFWFPDPKRAVDMAKLAVALNPTCSAELWNTLGDALFKFGRIVESRGAYLKAISVNESDVRARYNLAYVHIHEQDFPAALMRVAEGLALDKTGQYRDRLLKKQTDILTMLAQRNQHEYLLLINLVSRARKDKDPTELPPEIPGLGARDEA